MGKRRYRIGILGTAAGSHVQALVEALKRLEADVVIVPPQRLTSFIPGPATVTTGVDGEKENIVELDSLLVRSLPGGSLEQVIYRVDLLHRLEWLGLKVMNRAGVLEKTVDKFYTSSLLADAGLSVPQTVVTERFDEAMEAVRQMGKVVVKPLFGSLGTGMVLVEDPDVAHRVFRAWEAGRYVYYLQEFLPHGQEDFRLFVVGGKVISAMRRRGESWKTNIACGAVAEWIQPEPVLKEMALKTAEVLGADYLGVDILISRDRPYVIEANGIPGWTGLQSVSPVNIAAALADYTVANIVQSDRGRK